MSHNCSCSFFDSSHSFRHHLSVFSSWTFRTFTFFISLHSPSSPLRVVAFTAEANSFIWASFSLVRPLFNLQTSHLILSSFRSSSFVVHQSALSSVSYDSFIFNRLTHMHRYQGTALQIVRFFFLQDFRWQPRDPIDWSLSQSFGQITAIDHNSPTPSSFISFFISSSISSSSSFCFA